MTTEAVILMTIQGAILLVVIFQTKVMNSQIRKSNAIISQMEAYTKLIDIPKLKEFVEIREQTIIGRTELEKKEFQETLFKQLEIEKQNKYQYEQTNLELNRILFEFLVQYYDSAERREFIKNRFKSNQQTYLTLLEEFEKQNESISSRISVYKELLEQVLKVNAETVGTLVVTKKNDYYRSKTIKNKNN